MTVQEAIDVLEDVRRQAGIGIEALAGQAFINEGAQIPNGVIILADYVIVSRSNFPSLRSEKTSVLDPAKDTVGA